LRSRFIRSSNSFVFNSCFCEILLNNISVTIAPLTKNAIVINAGIYSDISSRKYRKGILIKNASIIDNKDFIPSVYMYNIIITNVMDKIQAVKNMKLDNYVKTNIATLILF